MQGLEYGLISKALFYVCDTISKMDLVIEREKNGFTNSNNGYISLRNLNKEVLFIKKQRQIVKKIGCVMLLALSTLVSYLI